MSPMYTLEDLDLDAMRGVVTFVRVDFNVPIAEGRVTDGTRLEAALPTLEELRRAGARVLLASHRGRPKGEPDPRYSLRAGRRNPGRATGPAGGLRGRLRR